MGEVTRLWLDPMETLPAPSMRFLLCLELLLSTLRPMRTARAPSLWVHPLSSPTLLENPLSRSTQSMSPPMESMVVTTLVRGRLQLALQPYTTLRSRLSKPFLFLECKHSETLWCNRSCSCPCTRTFHTPSC